MNLENDNFKTMMIAFYLVPFTAYIIGCKVKADISMLDCGGENTSVESSVQYLRLINALNDVVFFKVNMFALAFTLNLLMFNHYVNQAEWDADVAA